MTTPHAPVATIVSQTASLTLAMFDASSALDWVHTKAAATKAQFTGHPAEVMRGLGKGEDLAAIDVGASPGLAFELEGKSGRLEVYRIGATALALVAPPRGWWKERGDEAEVDALFAAALLGVEGEEVGELEVLSGKLAAVYLWHKKVGAAKELAAGLPKGAAVTFGDGYGEGDGGAVVDVGQGVYQLRKRELDGPGGEALVIMYLVRE